MRIIGRVLLGVGVFLIVLAPFMRYYAYPRLALAPQDQTLKIVSFGPNANLLNTSTFTNETTDLTATRLVAGDVAAAKAQGGNTDVWNSTVSTVDSTGLVRSRTAERAAFNANTSASVNCCDEYVSIVKGDDQQVHHTGIVFKFPFQTQKQTYQFWDLTLQRSLPMVYQDTETIDGVKTYKFEQVIKPTASGKAIRLNANALDLPGTGTVPATPFYSNIRSVWVEPETGVIIKGQEQQFNTLRVDNRDQLITTKATLAYSPASVQMLADTYGSKGSQLHLVRTVLPLIALIAGIVLVIAGLGLALMFGGPPGARRSSARTDSS